MRVFFGAARLAALGTVLIAQIAAAAVALRPADEPRFGRVVEGRVARLEPRRGDTRYPLTDVVLEPSGDRFTILGGYRDGMLWIASEEERFAVGERVRVELQDGAYGARPVHVERVSAPVSGLAPATDGGGVVPRVLSVSPESGPAADADIEVEITGTGFGSLGLGSVLFAGLFTHVPATVLEWTDTRIRALVPRPGLWNDPQVLSGPVKVWTPAGGWSDGDEFAAGGQYRVIFQFAGDRVPEARLPLGYYVNLSGWPWDASQVDQMLADAARPWNEVRTSFARFVSLGHTELIAGPKKDQHNVIGFVPDWQHPSSWLAVTWSGIDSLTGERLEADVEINGDRPWSIDATTPFYSYDLQTTMTHEFGHWLRLGHVQEPGHVMLVFQNMGEQRRILGIGEREGASWIYPTYGEATASTDSAYFGGAHPDALVLEARLVDRRGRPLAGVPREDVGLVPEWTDAPAGHVETGGGVGLHPEGPTDAQGRTRFVVTSAAGSGQVRFTVRGPAGRLHDQPVVYVSDGDRTAPRAPLALTVPWPNPLRGGALRASVRLGAPVERLTARVLDVRGRQVAELWNGPGSGDVLLTWDPSAGVRPAPGLYFLQVETNGRIERRKLVVASP